MNGLQLAHNPEDIDLQLRAFSRLYANQVALLNQKIALQQDLRDRLSDEMWKLKMMGRVQYFNEKYKIWHFIDKQSTQAEMIVTIIGAKNLARTQKHPNASCMVLVDGVPCGQTHVEALTSDPAWSYQFIIPINENIQSIEFDVIDNISGVQSTTIGTATITFDEITEHCFNQKRYSTYKMLSSSPLDPFGRKSTNYFMMQELLQDQIEDEILKAVSTERDDFAGLLQLTFEPRLTPDFKEKAFALRDQRLFRINTLLDESNRQIHSYAELIEKAIAPFKCLQYDEIKGLMVDPMTGQHGEVTHCVEVCGVGGHKQKNIRPSQRNGKEYAKDEDVCNLIQMNEFICLQGFHQPTVSQSFWLSTSLIISFL
eukprot:TRINITY_DN6295_c0_g1_i22.p1 TRINITY_DN6295_c0_g1~~TRINITY_DN6295_c0_g1_i22.p1  ORF type:complete len:370 (-),score=23.46 TRINITY_DN6295_c0_g1_i22:138-1247(-)